MFAIVETGGKQYSVAPNETIEIEKLDAAKGDKVTFEKVLLIADGDSVTLGKPEIKGAKVAGIVLEQGKGDKIRVFKYKAKSRYRKTIGHRQPFTAVKIEAINLK